MKIAKLIQKFLPAIIVALSISTIVVMSNFFQLTSNIKDAAILNTGLQTCYQRIHQTFTASILKNNTAVFLQKDFFNSTEQCLGDVIQLAESVFATSSASILDHLNELSLKAHAFHKVFKEQSSVIKKDSTLNLVTNHYGVIEEKTDSLIGKIDTEIIHFNKKSKKLLIWTYLLLCLSILGTIIFLFIFRNRQIQLIDLDEQAKELSSFSGQGFFNEKVKDFVAELTNKAGLKNTQALIHEFIENYDQETTEEPKQKPSNSLIQIEDIQMSEQDLVKNVANLDILISNVITQLSQNLFKKGILLNVDIAELSIVQGNEDAITYLIFQALNNSIKHGNKDSLTQRISISTRRHGGTIILEISDNGKGFQPELLKILNDTSKSFSNHGNGLAILEDIAKEEKVRVSFSNALNSSGEIKGAKVKFIFKSTKKAIASYNILKTRQEEALFKPVVTSKDASKQIKIVKGTKKEMLQRIKSGHQI